MIEKDDWFPTRVLDIYLKRANGLIYTQYLNNFAEGKGFLASSAARQ